MNTPVDDEEFTALVDADIPRVDLVDKAANGTTFLIAKQADGAGLLSPDLVRDLIGKTAEPLPQEETVTMTGSPGAIAKLMHEAAVRAAERDTVEKAEISQARQNDLPDSDFAYIEPGGSKDDEGKTTPRSLRHFPIMDAAHVRNALSRAPQSPFGDKAMPKIRAAAKKFNIDVAKMVGSDLDDGVDGMDPTVVLAEPDDGDDMPGDPNDPGSPAWEAIDAATAQKWLSIAYRVKNALGVMAERELLEAASADPDDAEDAWNLQDAQCAMDYVIGILANFAADEQAEATLGAEAMDAVGKALAGADQPLGTIEALVSVRKAGRSLSAANEQAIRDAVSSLQKVLASLPAAPVEKTANEESDMPQPTTAEDATRESGQEPAMGSREVDPKPEAGVPVTDMTKGSMAGDMANLDQAKATIAQSLAVAKADADKKAMVVVYDQKGRLVGICDPDDITPVANAEAEPDDMSDTSDDDGSDSSDDTSTETTDLTPQPAAEAGTPANNVPDTGDDDQAVTKTTHHINDTDLSEMLKSSLIPALEEIVKAHSATQAERIATTGDAVLELVNMVETLKGQVTKLEEQPAQPKVFTQGVGPRPLPQHLRGHDQGGTPMEVDFAKAAELKKKLSSANDAGEQQDAYLQLQDMAIAQLAAMRRG